MHSRDLALLIMLFCLALAGTAAATYAGDRPLNNTFFGELNGDYFFSMGDSFYSSSLDPGARYSVNFSVDIPGDAGIRFQRLYVYWGWSRIEQKAIYPVISLRDSRQPDANLTLLNRYSDSKGFVSKYDFYSGLDAYDLPPLLPGANNFSVTLSQDGPPNSSILCFGMAVLAVYEHSGYQTFTSRIDRYPGPGETVDLYATIETRPPTVSVKTPLSAAAALVAAGAAFLVAGRRFRRA